MNLTKSAQTVGFFLNIEILQCEPNTQYRIRFPYHIFLCENKSQVGVNIGERQSKKTSFRWERNERMTYILRDRHPSKMKK